MYFTSAFFLFEYYYDYADECKWNLCRYGFISVVFNLNYTSAHICVLFVLFVLWIVNEWSWIFVKAQKAQSFSHVLFSSLCWIDGSMERDVTEDLSLFKKMILIPKCLDDEIHDIDEYVSIAQNISMSVDEKSTHDEIGPSRQDNNTVEKVYDQFSKGDERDVHVSYQEVNGQILHYEPSTYQDHEVE